MIGEKRLKTRSTHAAPQKYKAVCQDTGVLKCEFDMDGVSLIKHGFSKAKVFQHIGVTALDESLVYLGDIVLIGRKVMEVQWNPEHCGVEYVTRYKTKEIDNDYSEFLVYFPDEAEPDKVLGNIYTPKKVLQESFPDLSFDQLPCMAGK